MSTTMIHRYLDRSNSEQSQAISRLVLVGFLLFFGWVPGDLRLGWPDANVGILLTGLGTWLALSIIILVATTIWPTPNSVRRIIAMVADIAGVTFALYFAGQAGGTYAGFYLLFVVGDGLRYGRRYLFASQVLSATAFQIVAFAPWWRDERSVIFGWTVIIILLPSFISNLTKRTNDTEDTINKKLAASPSGPYRTTDVRHVDNRPTKPSANDNRMKANVSQKWAPASIQFIAVSKCASRDSRFLARLCSRQWLRRFPPPVTTRGRLANKGLLCSSISDSF